MRMKLRLILTLLAALVPSVAFAQGATGVRPGIAVTPWVTHVTSLGTNANRATACITTTGFNYLTINEIVDRDGTPLVSAAATTCKAHYSSDCTDTIPIQLGACSGNTCTEFNPSWAIDADEGWGYRFDVATYDYVLCTVTFTAGDSGDVITIKTRKSKE